jgi:hypothetical protein
MLNHKNFGRMLMLGGVGIALTLANYHFGFILLGLLILIIGTALQYKRQ